MRGQIRFSSTSSVESARPCDECYFGGRFRFPSYWDGVTVRPWSTAKGYFDFRRQQGGLNWSSRSWCILHYSGEQESVGKHTPGQRGPDPRNLPNRPASSYTALRRKTGPTRYYDYQPSGSQTGPLLRMAVCRTAIPASKRRGGVIE